MQLESSLNANIYRFHQEQLDSVLQSKAEYPVGRFAGRGIVMCAGGPRYFTGAWISLHILREVLKCSLPVEVWYLGREEMDEAMVTLLESIPEVKCINAFEVRKSHPARRLFGWESKPYAIINSSFREVIFIDADNTPVQNPAIFLETSEYRATGATFWPDITRLPRDHEIWKICRIAYRDEPEFETGQIVVDKERCWRSLQVTMHMNEYSDFYYQHVYGDKTTFQLAWRLLEQPFSMPSTAPRVLRCTGPGGIHAVCALEQHDFKGKTAFLHRTGSKWILIGQNPPVRRFRLDAECREFLDRLRGVWSGRVQPAADSATALPAECEPSHCYVYRRVSSDERVIELLADGHIGHGFNRSRIDHDWRMLDENGTRFVEISGPAGTVARLQRGWDNVWRGSQLIREQMPLELEPVVTSGSDLLSKLAAVEKAQPRHAGARAQLMDAICVLNDGVPHLRYLLRSVAKHANWLRRIYCVTSPNLIDTALAKVAIVPAEGAIEDRSEPVLYLSSEVFFGSEVSPGDFALEPNGGRLSVPASNQVLRCQIGIVDIPRLSKKLSEIALLRPKFFAFDIEPDLIQSAAAETVRMKLKAFLHWYFRESGEFEES
jgi:hypothetical protein